MEDLTVVILFHCEHRLERGFEVINATIIAVGNGCLKTVAGQLE
jgi:hypothetical protein